MTCKEIIDALMEYLDGGLTPGQRAEFDRHLAVCPACRDYLRTYGETIRLGKASLCEHADEGPQELPASLVTAVMAAIRKR